MRASTPIEYQDPFLRRQQQDLQQISQQLTKHERWIQRFDDRLEAIGRSGRSLPTT